MQSRADTFTGIRTWLMPLALLLAVAAAPAPAASVWVEGEAAAEKTVSKHSWYDAVNKDGFSGGEWLSHYGDKPGTATYTFDAPDAGEYTFWWRGNPFAAKVSYALNDGKPVEIDFSDKADKRGEYMVSDKPDHRFLAWVKVGKVRLSEGENKITLTFHSDLANHGGVDAFLFDSGNFVPSGTLKPDGNAGQATGGAGKEVAAGPDEAIWVEGEKPTEAEVSKHGWYDAVKKDGFSGGEWLSHYDAAKPGTANYAFDVVKADEYTFWWRGNVSLAKVSYQLNGGPLREVDFTDKRGEYMVSDKPDHRFLAWVKLGKVALKAGRNTVTFKFHSDQSNHGGVDAFCLTRIPFVPSGANQPTSRTATTADPGDWFPVVFDTDPFSDKSVIDMSKLIEAPAGKHGFLKRDKADLRFQNAKTPVKFWGCGANLGEPVAPREQLTQRIRYLRKHGVNMVRQHPLFDQLGPLVDGKIDSKRFDDYDWWFAELKKHGIYTTWSLFYPLLIGPADGYDPELFNELDVKDKDRNLRGTYGLVNVERKLQNLQFRYAKAVLLHKNSYTGLRYVDDPALAVVEFHNEDNVFFHNPLNDLRDGKRWPLHAKRFRQRWAAWVKERYKTEDAAKQAWGGLRGGDAWQQGDLETMAAYHLGPDGPLYEWAGQHRRAGDFVRFLAETQRAFYERREKEIRSLGYKAVTVTTAWHRGGAGAEPANIWCDTAADMIDEHTYFGGGAGGHRIAEGEVLNESHLAKPGSGLLEVATTQVEDRPFSVTEWTQLPPNQWKAEAAPLMAFYGLGLQGWDASYHFVSSRPWPGDGWPNLSSYVTDTPHYIAQFPALAFAVWHSHVKQAPPAAARRIEVDDLFAGKSPIRHDAVPGPAPAQTTAPDGARITPVQAAAIGRISTSFAGGRSEFADFAKYWDASARTIRSMTGELTWDYGRQVVTVGSPKTQAVIGRAGGQTFDLPGVSVDQVKTPFVSLILTPLDDRPLAESKQILVTAVARDMQTGTKYSEDGKRLLALGGPPLLMEPVQATIKLKGAKPKAVNVLDVYGVPTGQTVKPATDGSFAISGAHRTYYYEVKR